MLSAHFMHGLLDVLIRGLCFSGVDYMDVVVFLRRTGVAFHLIGIEDQNQCTSRETLVIAADVHQLVPGAVDVHLRQAVQIVPGEDDVVPVQQISLLPRRAPNGTGRRS